MKSRDEWPQSLRLQGHNGIIKGPEASPLMLCHQLQARHIALQGWRPAAVILALQTEQGLSDHISFFLKLGRKILPLSLL